MYDDIGFIVSGKIRREGLRKVVIISISDGDKNWEFTSSATFTMAELRQRFPRFFAPKPKKGL